jgi:hypothetical protein
MSPEDFPTHGREMADAAPSVYVIDDFRAASIVGDDAPLEPV